MTDDRQTALLLLSATEYAALFLGRTNDSPPTHQPARWARVMGPQAQNRCVQAHTHARDLALGPPRRHVLGALAVLHVPRCPGVVANASSAPTLAQIAVCGKAGRQAASQSVSHPVSAYTSPGRRRT